MKVKLLTTISFLTYQIGISQTEKLLQGKVISQELALKNVEVINKTAKTSTRTNELGEFSISAKQQDSLIFFSKNYLIKRLQLTLKDLEKSDLIVEMTPKAEELEDVVVSRAVFNKTELKNIANNKEAISEIKLDKMYKDVNQRYLNINDGRIKNGLNYSHTIFDKPKKKSEDDNRFKKLVTASCPPDFFTKDLKIKPEEKELFIDFCDADSKSKELLENPNVLTILDFLYLKNEEFKKLK